MPAYSSVPGIRNHGFGPSQRVSKQIRSLLRVSFVGRRQNRPIRDPNPALQFLFRSFYLPDWYCRCVGCLADKASPVSWRVLVTPIPPQAAPLPRSQEFSFVLEGTRHSKPTSRLHHCLADILLLCPGGWRDTRHSKPTELFRPESLLS